MPSGAKGKGDWNGETLVESFSTGLASRGKHWKKVIEVNEMLLLPIDHISRIHNVDD